VNVGTNGTVSQTAAAAANVSTNSNLTDTVAAVGAITNGTGTSNVAGQSQTSTIVVRCACAVIGPHMCVQKNPLLPSSVSINTNYGASASGNNIASAALQGVQATGDNATLTYILSGSSAAGSGMVSTNNSANSIIMGLTNRKQSAQ
jgi:hypothetical protein